MGKKRANANTWDCFCHTVMVFVQNYKVHFSNEEIHDQVTTVLDRNAVVYHGHVFLLHGPSEIFDLTEHRGQANLPLVEAWAVDPELSQHF